MNPVKSSARRRPVVCALCVLTAVLVIVLGAGAVGRAQQQAGPQGSDAIAPGALAQIEALLREKDSRTPAQQKLDSRLVYAVKMARGDVIADGVARLSTILPLVRDANNAVIGNRVALDVRAEVSDRLLQQLRAMGADIAGASAEYRTIELRADLDRIEAIAELPDVRFIQPVPQALTSRLRSPARRAAGPPSALERPRPAVRRRVDREALRARLLQPIVNHPGTNVGSRQSQGDATHRAAAARTTFGFDGTGVKIGVLSDSVCNLAAAQASGDLGPVTVLPGQAGPVYPPHAAPCHPMDPPSDEGTAMLEIIHDLAPGAQLYFATAFNGITSFAQNIRDLQAAGCDIIVDDVFYFTESPFQDGQALSVLSPTNGGAVIQAVKDVTAAGALYFSSAGNEGNIDSGTSGTWEGDFLDGGAVALPVPGSGRLHSFGPANYNVLAASGGNANILFWSDPLGASGNDYDLFLLNGAGTAVMDSSTNVQNGNADPFEIVNPGVGGDRLVIVKSDAAAGRFLHLGTIRGRLATAATAGETHGHAAVNSANSFGVAATPASGPFPNPFNATNVVEPFSSNGPRRIFFQSDGTAITPGNSSSTGGLVLNKPDITAADGVSVTGAGGFPSTFYGTSAAAPHAAAIAGLLKSSNPALTASQISTALAGTALDIQAVGVDRNSGFGIVQAFQAMEAILATSAPAVVTGAASGITPTGATLNGTANPNGVTASAHFEYGLTTAYGSMTPVQAMGSGNLAAAIGGGTIGGLTCNTLYHFRAVATNANGTTNGADATFTTSVCLPPTVVTGIATSVSVVSATLNGTANPNGFAATGHFQYGTTLGYGSTTPVQVLGSGSGDVAIGGGAIAGLTCNTLYHFRAVATNANGTSLGSDAAFATLPCAFGDFDADGKGDLLLRNRSTGQNIGWLMNGLTVSIAAFMPTIADTNWEIRGRGDFDGDGKADVIWRNKSTGQDIGWLMNGLTVSTSAFMPTIADTNWEIKGVGDFDGDGKADVILRNRSTGQNIGWLMNGLTVSLAAFMPTIADTNWEIVGVGDFDGNGKSDVLLRNRSTGQNIGWLMDGLTVATSAFLPTIADTNWEIKGVGDIDGDGKADVVLRNKSTGQNIGWLMNGLTVSLSAFLPTIADTNWEIEGAGDFNGDGKADIVLRNKVTGQDIGWLMNGLVVSTSAFMPTIADTNWEFVGQGQ